MSVHCKEVTPEHTSVTAQDALTEVTPKPEINNSASYNEWIKTVQTERNKDWKFNVQFNATDDTPSPPDYDKFTLFHSEVENYAMSNTSLASINLQRVATLTEEQNMFMPCMVGTLESQFLKMMCQIKNAKKCLDIGTFTGMSALAMAEGMGDQGSVITLENDEKIARVAQQGFDKSSVGNKITMIVGSADEAMKQMQLRREKFDIIFIDADKEAYIKYYDLAMDGLLEDDGLILVDNSLCALLYDKTDIRSQRLHEFNQHVKNDKRVEQVVMTIREGITMIRRISDQTNSS